MFGLDPAHGAIDGAHDDRLGLDDVLAEFHALEHRAVGYAGRREQAIAAHHVLDLVFLARVLDAHFRRALAPLLGVEHETALHLAADAAQSRGRQHAFGRAADAEIDIDAGLIRLRGVDYAGHVAVADQAHRRAGLAHRRDDIGVARAIEDHGGDVLRLYALGLGELADVFIGRSVEIDDILRITGPDRDLVHIDVGGVQERPLFGNGKRGDGPRHVLGAQ